MSQGGLKRAFVSCTCGTHLLSVGWFEELEQPEGNTDKELYVEIWSIQDNTAGWWKRIKDSFSILFRNHYPSSEDVVIDQHKAQEIKDMLDHALQDQKIVPLKARKK